MSRGYTDLQFTGSGDLPVRVFGRNVLILGEEGCRATFSDVDPDGLADLLARAFEALASAPDLTPEEHDAVRERMSRAVGQTYWQRVEAESTGGAA